VNIFLGFICASIGLGLTFLYANTIMIDGLMH
jgi:hypothetical protein